MTSYMSLGFGKYHGIFPDKLLVNLVSLAVLKSQLARQLLNSIQTNQKMWGSCDIPSLPCFIFDVN